MEKTTKVSHYLVLNSRELLALYLARSMLSPLKETPFFDDLRTTFNKIEEKLSSKGKDYLDEVSTELHFEPGPRWGLGLDPDVIETVRSACSERQKLKINYKSNNSKTVRDRILGPQFLYFSKGALYLVAEDLESNTNKVFSLTRINTAEMLDEEYTGEQVDVSKYFDGSFGVFQTDQIEDIELEFKHPISEYIRERKWHSSQRIVNLDQGRITLKLELGITPELVQWVLGFGANVKVMKPESLKEEIIEGASDILDVYNASTVINTAS